MKYVSRHLEKEACRVKTISSLEFGNDSFEAAVHNAPHCPAAVGVPAVQQYHRSAGGRAKIRVVRRDC